MTLTELVMKDLKVNERDARHLISDALNFYQGLTRFEDRENLKLFLQDYFAIHTDFNSI